jgi:metal-responsive CopG/Arc/MetJ family transcriptional regulator
MTTRKTAIAVPEEVLAEVDRAARSRGVSRSSYITAVLRAAVRARRDAEITAKLNALFSDEAATAAQLRETSDLDGAGSDWADESW